MSMNHAVVEVGDADQAAPSRWQLVSSEQVAAWGLTLLVAASAFSGSDVVSTVLVLAGIALGAPAVAGAVRTDRLVQVALLVSAFWFVSGLMVQSLPTAPGPAFDWASSEGRRHLVVASIAIAATIHSTSIFISMVRRIVGAITASFVVAFPLHVADVSLARFQITRGDLFVAFTSSHHVIGFLSAAVVVLLAAMPTLYPGWWRWAMSGAGVIALALSASRTASVGLVVALVLVAGIRFGRRGLGWGLALVLVLVIVGIAAVPRFRLTADIMTRPEFVSEAVGAFNGGTRRDVRQRSNSPVEANILSRFSLWGQAADEIAASPIVGHGVHRGDDEVTRWVGWSGVVEVGVSGTRRHTHGEPHNMFIFLLSETGVVGALVFASPFVLATVRLRRRRHRPAADRPDAAIDLDHSISAAIWGVLVMGLIASLFSVGLLGTGLGLIVCSVFFAGAGVLTAGDPQ